MQTEVASRALVALVDAAVALHARPARSLEKWQGSSTFSRTEKRQQVELLKDIAGVIDAKAVAGAGGQYFKS